MSENSKDTKPRLALNVMICLMPLFVPIGGLLVSLFQGCAQ